MKKGKKILNVVIDVVVWIVIILAALITIISLNTKNGVASFAGITPFSIQSQSMEPTIMTGDLIITKAYDKSQELKVGDIISFFAVEEDTTIVKTHRITEIKTDENNTYYEYVTKGDNNDAVDENTVAPGDIVSVYSGKRYTNLGKVLDFIKSKVGFFVCIILPLFLFFIYQLYNFITLVVEEKKAKKIAVSR